MPNQPSGAREIIDAKRGRTRAGVAAGGKAERPVAGSPMPDYPMKIDNGTVPSQWGTNTGSPRMVDKRDRSQKIGYFTGIGNESVLEFLMQNFPTKVKQLGKKIMLGQN